MPASAGPPRVQNTPGICRHKIYTYPLNKTLTMKKLILSFCILLSASATYAQDFYMNGRFSNTTPDINAQIDSAAFNFTNTNYTYFINDNANPSSFGTYAVIIGSMSDTLVLMEDSLGVCSSNGTGTMVKMEIDKTITPFHSIILSETAQSMDSCTSHSLRMSGTFIATSGTIISTSSVNSTKQDNGLQAYTYGNQLMVTGKYNERVSLTITNVSGQKVMKTQEAQLSQGEKRTFDLSNLNPGIYFVLIQSEHGRKAVKVAL